MFFAQNWFFRIRLDYDCVDLLAIKILKHGKILTRGKKFEKSKFTPIIFSDPLADPLWPRSVKIGQKAAQRSILRKKHVVPPLKRIHVHDSEYPTATQGLYHYYCVITHTRFCNLLAFHVESPCNFRENWLSSKGSWPPGPLWIRPWISSTKQRIATKLYQPITFEYFACYC